MRRPLELKVDPRRTRLIFLGLLAGSLVLIWAAGAVSLYFIKSNDRAHLEARIQSDALILEEHASRTLDTVAARLDCVCTRGGKSCRKYALASALP